MGANFSTCAQGGECLMWSLNFLLLRENLCACDIPPTCGSLYWGCRYQLYPAIILNVAFSSYLYLWNSCYASLQVILRSALGVQLTFGQHEFELHRFTYKSLFSINTVLIKVFFLMIFLVTFL